MARGPRRGVAPLLIALAVTACAGVSASPSTTPEAMSSTSSMVAANTTTSTASTSSTSSTANLAAPTTSGEFEVDAEVRVPDGQGPFPAVVLVHGGGWVTGDPSTMRPLAELLQQNGYLTINTRYDLATRGNPSFPGAVDDVACAVRFAATHPDSDGTVAVIGHSAGAHIGAIVALTGDDFTGDCPLPGSGTPDRFVGLAGPYDSSRLGLAIIAFFGVPESVGPDLWAEGNPQTLTDENPGLDSLIMYGDEDGLVADSFAIDFAAALSDSGSAALLERVEGARHNDMLDPELVGDLIVAWLDR